MRNRGKMVSEELKIGRCEESIVATGRLGTLKSDWHTEYLSEALTLSTYGLNECVRRNVTWRV